MPAIPSPPGATSTVDAHRVLLLAPHYDDEVLGCGGLLRQVVVDGGEVFVLFLTDSSGGIQGEAVPDPGAYSQERRREAEAAATELGVRIQGHLDLPDGRLLGYLEELSRGIASALEAIRPDLLLVTSPTEVSEDHVAAFLGLHRCLSPLRPGDELESLARDLRILTYEVNHLQHPDLLLDVSRHLPVLERAMACHAGQQARHDYWGAYLGRGKFRALTLGPEVRAVEAYRRLTLGDFTRRGAADLVRRLGGGRPPTNRDDGPLISVIVRTHNRPELLAVALESLAQSTYRRLQVVLVNDGGEPPGLPEDFPLPVVRIDLERNVGRAAAANAGVAAATGDYIGFLDDDDIVDPEHFELLWRTVSAAGVRVAYSDAAVVVHELDAGEGWQATERRLPYSRDFDPELLLVDNYIPFHTLLMERSLVDEARGPGAGPFDPSLPIFEDWDFLIRLAKITPFHHLRRVTCEYRQYRGGGHHVLGDRPRRRADFLAMKAKVIECHGQALDSEILARVVDGLRAEQVAGAEDLRHERQRRQVLEADFHRLRGAQKAAEDHALGLQALETRAREENEGLRRQVAELHGYQKEQSRSLRQAYDEIERLTDLIAAMEGTRAWRLHQKIQGLKS